MRIYFKDSELNQLQFFEQEDVIYWCIAEGEAFNSIELTPNITAEINASGR